MSQNDFTIANQGFPAFRADLNSALQALATNNSGDTEPTTMFANMWWYDSANNIMYIRNEDNDAWIKFAELDQANDKFVLSGTLQLDDGTVSAPALTFNSDTNMGIYRGGTDILKFVTAGTDAVTIDASQQVGIGETSPLSKFHVKGVDSGADVFTDTYLTVENSGDTRMTILSGTSNIGGIKFGDSGLNRQGGIDYVHSDDSMRFATTNTERMKIDSSGHVTMPYQSAFSVHKNSIHQDNFANTGDEVTVTWNTERFDNNGDFSGNTFTAPVTGKYILTTTMRINFPDTVALFYIASIVTSNNTYHDIIDPNYTADLSFRSFHVSVVADMDASDTAYVTIRQSGGTVQSDVNGDPFYTYFTGALLC